MYNAIIKPILTYNLSSLAVPNHIFQLLNSAHRKQLRRLLGIFYPKTITNSKLYQRTNSQPIQIDVAQLRLSLFGHILRSDIKTPANQMMIQYFTNPRNINKFHGRSPITLPCILHRDLLLVNYNLRNFNDFLRLREIAMNKTAWKRISETIVTKTKINCFQELEINEQKRRTKRQQLDAITINYTTEDGQRKRIRLTTGNIPKMYIRIRLPDRRRREPDNDMDQVLTRPAQRRRIEEQEPDVLHRNF